MTPTSKDASVSSPIHADHFDPEAANGTKLPPTPSKATLDAPLVLASSDVRPSVRQHLEGKRGAFDALAVAKLVAGRSPLGALAPNEITHVLDVATTAWRGPPMDYASLARLATTAANRPVLSSTIATDLARRALALGDRAREAPSNDALAAHAAAFATEAIRAAGSDTKALGEAVDLRRLGKTLATNRPDLHDGGSPRLGSAPTIDKRLTALAKVAEAANDAGIGPSLTAATQALDEALTTWPHQHRSAKKVHERLTRAFDGLVLAGELLANDPSPKTEAAVKSLLDATQPLRDAALRYAALRSPRLEPGRRTESELAAHREALDAYKADEVAIRHAFIDAYQASQLDAYVAIREAAGITVDVLDASKFRTNPLEAIERLDIPDDDDPNRAYAELTVGGETIPVGPSRSGGGREAAVPNNPYPEASRHLECVSGQHNKSRANDSEIRILGLANEALAAHGDAPATLHVFTELPPCPSCQRAMAQFTADHPNVKIVVHHLAK